MKVKNFYLEIVKKLLSEGILHKDMRILVVCGNHTDKFALETAGFNNIVISNLDSRIRGDEFHPFEWSFQNVEDLEYKEGTFDFCIVHSGLHHCYLPFKGLFEMYRVSRKGILLFEPYDNFITRLGIKLGFGQEYEHASVFSNECLFGGVANSLIPNYVYRFTEREIVKAVSCFDPSARQYFRFFHTMRLPWEQLQGRKRKFFLYVMIMMLPLIRIVEWFFPKQCNHFAALVLKPSLPGDMHPWLKLDNDNIELNNEWVEKVYKKRGIHARSLR